VAVWMAWDAWLEYRGLRIVDWPPDAEYMHLEAWVDEFVAYWQASTVRDERLEEPELAPLAQVLDRVSEVVAEWEALPVQPPTPPGVRKLLIRHRDLAELVHAVIVSTRQPKDVAAILGCGVQSLHDAFHAHELLPPLPPRGRHARTTT
jgi:hypothetical protein